VSEGLVGCVESVRIASPTLNVQYDLHMPASEDIELARGIRAYLHQAICIYSDVDCFHCMQKCRSSWMTAGFT